MHFSSRDTYKSADLYIDLPETASFQVPNLWNKAAGRSALAILRPRRVWIPSGTWKYLQQMEEHISVQTIVNYNMGLCGLYTSDLLAFFIEIQSSWYAIALDKFHLDIILQPLKVDSLTLVQLWAEVQSLLWLVHAVTYKQHKRNQTEPIPDSIENHGSCIELHQLDRPKFQMMNNLRPLRQFCCNIHPPLKALWPMGHPISMPPPASPNSGAWSIADQLLHIEHPSLHRSHQCFLQISPKTCSFWSFSWTNQQKAWDRDVLLMNEILHYDNSIYPYVSYSLWGYLHMVNPRMSFFKVNP